MRADTLRNVFEPVFRARHIEAAILFGSAATGNLRLDSDIDIAVERAGPFDFHHHSELVSDLRKAAVLSGFEQEIDISYLDRADPLFLKKIFESAVHLYGDPRRVSAWRLRAFRVYQDFLPYLRIEAQSVRRLADRLSA